MTRPVALVTGAGQGIGAQTARTLSASGYIVVRSDRSDASTWEDVEGAANLGFSLDVTDPQACADAVAGVTAEYGGLNVLVNCAGIVVRAPAEEYSLEAWNKVLNVNLTGTFLMCQAAFVALADADDAAIVNVASANGHIAVHNTVAYCVSKAGVIHLTRVLALEWAGSGIRVNSVGPTIVPTGMTEDVRGMTDYMRDKLATIPLGRMATSTDVADSIAFLASPAAGMVTGQTLFIDGGATIR